MSEVENEERTDELEEIIQALPGRILPKRYRIDKLIVANPYSAFYRTIYEPEEKLVLLQVYRCVIKSEEDYQFKRFKQEYKRLSGLKHANIGKVIDHGLMAEGLPYMVMEALIGPTLAEVLVHQNRVEADQCVLIFSQVAKAVQAAHDQGILHETLNPNQIVITETENGDAIVKTTGFGMLALHAKLGMPLKTPKSKAEFIGTANYMSPEQCFEGAEVDGRSDIYSIGCMMYESISGQVPYLATDDKVMKMQLESEAPAIDKLRKDLVFPRRLLSIQQKCMLKDPTRRYQFARDLQYDLEKDVDPSEREERTVIPQSMQKAEQRVKDSKENPLKMIGQICAAIALMAIILYLGSYVVSMTGKLADNTLWKSKFDAGQQAMSEGKMEDAASSLDGALTEAHKFPAPDLRYAMTQTEVGACNTITGRYGNALNILREALQTEKASKKENDIATARTLEVLSCAELAAGKISEAEEHAKWSVTVAEHLAGEHTVQLYKSYLQMFKVFVAQGKLDDAQAEIEKMKATIGATDIILSMEIISGKKQCEAILMQARKNYADAEKEYQDVLGSRQEKIGLGSLACIDTMILIGRLYAAEGKMQKATDTLQSAYEAREKVLGDSSPALAELSLEIGKLYDSAKNKGLAEKYYRQSLELAEKSWGKGKVETLPYIDALANRLKANGERQKAEVYEVEALDIRHPERVSKLGQQ